MSISKGLYQHQPAARMLWSSVREKHKTILTKNRNQALAAFRRLFNQISEAENEVAIKHPNPLLDLVMDQLDVKYITIENQILISDTWNYLVGCNG